MRTSRSPARALRARRSLAFVGMALPPLLFGIGGAGTAAGPLERPALEAPAAPVQRARTSEASLQGEVALVTGSTGGLGREVARRLAARGAHVIIHGRNQERGRSLVEEIEESGVGGARFYRADLASFEEVRQLARAVRRDYDRLDVLVNNAGILLPDGPFRSEDGHELHFQVNYLSGFLLTRLLLPLLEESAPARIVNVSSRSQSAIRFDDPMMEEGYSLRRAYGQSKLAQILFTFELAERLEGTGVTVNALHPAGLMNTDLVLELGMEPQSTVEEGARAVVHLVTAPDLGSGRYFDRTRPARAAAQAYDEEAREALWRLSEVLTGVRRP